MNYIKKKIKGSSKKAAAAAAAEEDDDFDPNLFHVLQRPAEGAPEGWVPYDDRVDEESDEWRAFRLLTQRVTETLTETKENLSKIVASTALTETSREWQIRKITATSEEQQQQPQQLPPINGVATTTTTNSVKPERPAPPRPPPPGAAPSAAAAAVRFDDDRRFEAAFPSANFAAGSEPGDFKVRPRSPKPPRPQKPAAAPPVPVSVVEEASLEFDLGAEFGFEPVKPVSQSSTSHHPLQSTGSLFLDDDEDVSSAIDDPFDTSFVNEIDHKKPESSSGHQEISTIKGVITDEQLEALCGHPEPETEEDDPFVIKDDIVAAISASEEEKSDRVKSKVQEKEKRDDDVDQITNMDPFESFLQGASSAGGQRAKSPNPFLMDSSEDVVTTTSTISTSNRNPFAAASSDLDDDPFATQLALNPFASMSQQSYAAGAETGTGADLFGFGDAFEDDNTATSTNDLSNPFASFAQTEVVSTEKTSSAVPSSDSGTFDPFGTTNEPFSSDILKSSQIMSAGAATAAAAAFEDPFGLGSRGTSTMMATMTMTTIPAAPSSQDLFGLNDDNDNDPNNLFQNQNQDDVVDQKRDEQESAGLIESNFAAAFEVDAEGDEDAQDIAPHIDFFNADSAVVNVSGVSVELSEVSPAKMDDDFDEFFVGSNDDEDELHGEARNHHDAEKEKDEEIPVQVQEKPPPGPPPRPPPPAVVTKPARPPPPKVAEGAAAATAPAKPEVDNKTFDAFFAQSDGNFVGEVLHKERAFDKSWDAFPPLVPGDDVTVDVAGASLLQQQHDFPPGHLPDPFGLSSADHVANEERRKSGTYDTYERKVSGPIDELLGCFETAVAPIVPAVAQAAASELDFFGAAAQPEVTSERHVAFDLKQPLGTAAVGGDLFACEPLTPPDDDDSLDTGQATAIEAEAEDDKDVVPFTDMAAFDAFDAKFQSTSETTSAGTFDVFGTTSGGVESGFTTVITTDDNSQGFGTADDFDQFFALKETPAAPKPSPARFPAPTSITKIPEKPSSDVTTTMTTAAMGIDSSSSDSDDTGPDFSVFIRPKMKDKDEATTLHLGPIPALAPPPKSPMRSPPSHTSPRFNPFDKEPDATTEDAREGGFVDVDAFSAAFSTPVPESFSEIPPHDHQPGSTPPPKIGTSISVDSQESPGSPLFEVDDSEPLEDFIPKRDASEGWDLMLRQPSKKKLTGQRFWKKVYVTISDNGVLHLYNKSDDKDAFQELPLQACYSLTEIGAQQYDTYGKIFTVKLQYVFYRERVGVRPGQISKVTHGQVTSLGQLAKLGLPLEHSPQVSQLLKLGTQQYEELRIFIREVEDSLFHLSVHRDRALTYKTEEVQVTVVDELRAEVQSSGVVLSQLARVRVFFLAFIVGMPDVELGLNDITKQGREVVGRHDIIPVVTEEWIRLEKCEFHSCVTVSHFEKSRTIKFHPPDACFFEILRFRIRPPKNRELPLQVKATMSIIGNRVEIRADVLVPGCISRKHGQIPCEDVSIRFPLPECWIYLFRVEKHFRYGSLKSSARKPGKIKGLERIMGAGLTMEPSMIEVSTGQAKYEHQHRAIVWRVPRLPKDGQGAYTTQLFVCRMELTSYDQIPAELDHFVHVEFTMPATTVSHTTVRSVSVTNPNPPEKYVKYLARHKYRVEIEHVTATSECDYVAATTTGSAGGAAMTKGQSNSAQGHGTSDSLSNQ